MARRRYGAPSLGAAFASDTLHGWLIAAGFLLVGFAPTSRARVSADALVAWLRLAFKHLDAWRCRCAAPLSCLQSSHAHGVGSEFRPRSLLPIT